MIRQRLYRLLPAVALLAATPVLVGATGLTTSFIARVVTAQNVERALVGVEPLAWDSDLARSAQGWADHLAATGAFEHASLSALGDQGENLWAGSRSYYSVEAMVNAWVREKQQFKPGRFPDNSKTGSVADVGHYTQIVWRQTRKVGCALARGREEDVLVCRYGEAGNWIGEYPI